MAKEDPDDGAEDLPDPESENECEKSLQKAAKGQRAQKDEEIFNCAAPFASPIQRVIDKYCADVSQGALQFIACNRPFAREAAEIKFKTKTLQTLARLATQVTQATGRYQLFTVCTSVTDELLLSFVRVRRGKRRGGPS